MFSGIIVAPPQFHITFWGYVKFAEGKFGRSKATYPPVVRNSARRYIKKQH